MMSKVRTALKLIRKPKWLAKVLVEKTGITFFRVKIISKNYIEKFCLDFQNISNIVLRKKNRLRISTKDGTVLLVSPYIGVPQMMAVTNYINCW